MRASTTPTTKARRSRPNGKPRRSMGQDSPRSTTSEDGCAGRGGAGEADPGRTAGADHDPRCSTPVPLATYGLPGRAADDRANGAAGGAWTAAGAGAASPAG